MKFLNGFKTILGGAGTVVAFLSQAQVLPILPPKVQPYVMGAANVLLALGVIHKYEKATR
jgi:hypothetical protein